MAYAKDIRLSLQHTYCPVPKNSMEISLRTYSLKKTSIFKNKTKNRDKSDTSILVLHLK